MEDHSLMDFEALMPGLRRRYESLRPGSEQRRTFLLHMASLTRAYSEPMDYPISKVETFPSVLPVAYAVCHPECGISEFIVDGSTQECQNCGGTMYRTAVASYHLSKATTATQSGSKK